MNNASLRYDLENITTLPYLLCLAREFFAETGMIPAELEYHGVRLSYNSIEAKSSKVPSTNRHTSSATNADFLTEAGS